MKKVLLIFGAGGSLGESVSNVLIEKRYDKVYLFDVNEIETNNEKVSFVKTHDLGIEKNVEDALANVKVDQNTQYFLFSAIGGFAGGNDVIEMSYDDWNKMFTLNLNISFLLAKHFFNLCRESKGGAICFTSAMTSLNTAENKASYGTSKNALNYLVKTLAKEGKNYNISVNAVAPLALDTEENRKWMKDKSMLISPNEIGEVVFSLFSSRKIVSGNILELPSTLV